MWVFTRDKWQLFFTQGLLQASVWYFLHIFTSTFMVLTSPILWDLFMKCFSVESVLIICTSVIMSSYYRFLLEHCNLNGVRKLLHPPPLFLVNFIYQWSFSVTLKKLQKCAHGKKDLCSSEGPHIYAFL